MAGNSGEPGSTVVSKIAAILNTFTAAEEQTLSEIARTAGLPVTTAYRLLTELAERQLLERAGGRYRVGLSLRRMSASGDGGTALVEDRAAAVLDDLAAATGCRIRLGVLAWPNVAYMEKRPGSGTVTAFAADARLPAATSALGRVLLAYGPPGVVDTLNGVPSSTGPCIRPNSGFRRSLALVRRRQLAINPGGGQDGHCCFAKPVFGPGGQIVAALGMTVTDLDATLNPLIAVLTVAARSLSRELGGSDRPAASAAL